MKKYVIALLTILICASTVNFASAKTTTNSALSSAIRLYKAGNYSQSYLAFNDIVANDPSNAVAYYYLAMTSAQIGKKQEAISNYEKVLSLAPNGKLSDYATKGKICIETPEKCHEDTREDSATDRFIRGTFGSGFSKEARNNYETQKIQNLMREMNRNNEISPQKFKDYKDFSSEVPTNDEIVDAIRVLQNAGLGNIVGIGGNNHYDSEMSLLTGGQNSNNIEMLNLLLGGNRNSTSNLSPQVIQSLLTNQMSAGF